MKFLVSDLHIGHANVISYCNRPYKDAFEMNNDIVKRINSRVKKNDELYILGDVSLNPNSMEWLMERVKCKNIYLIEGNHDKCFRKNPRHMSEKIQNMRARYFKAGFKSIEITQWITLTKKRPWYKRFPWTHDKQITVQLNHFPFAPENAEKEDTRYLDQRPKDIGQILLHGHSHCWYRKRGRQIDVGFDGDLKVWSEEEIIDLIEDPRDYIPSPITAYYEANKMKSVLKNGDY